TPNEELNQIQMPGSNGDNIRENANRFEYTAKIEDQALVQTEKSGFGKLAGFLGAFIKTMQNWTDNTQGRLPGYRDRIAGVRLSPKEGGLNLNMPQEVIAALTARGQAAAEIFIKRFGSGSAAEKMNWNNHRWVRLRSLFAATEKFVERLDKACAHPDNGDVNFDDWLNVLPSVPPSFAWKSQSQHDTAIHTLADLRALAAVLKQNPTKLHQGSPRPRPELRPRAQI
ncbi:MAG: hypothetical protein U0984_02700, partial [Prosthecobacter sp.]|nr:hypothetical protein [Prosthecobacter sp.]